MKSNDKLTVVAVASAALCVAPLLAHQTPVAAATKTVQTQVTAKFKQQTRLGDAIYTLKQLLESGNVQDKETLQQEINVLSDQYRIYENAQGGVTQLNKAADRAEQFVQKYGTAVQQIQETREKATANIATLQKSGQQAAQVGVERKTNTAKLREALAELEQLDATVQLPADLGINSVLVDGQQLLDAVQGGRATNEQLADGLSTLTDLLATTKSTLERQAAEAAAAAAAAHLAAQKQAIADNATNMARGGQYKQAQEQTAARDFVQKQAITANATKMAAGGQHNQSQERAAAKNFVQAEAVAANADHLVKGGQFKQAQENTAARNFVQAAAITKNAANMARGGQFKQSQEQTAVRNFIQKQAIAANAANMARGGVYKQYQEEQGRLRFLTAQKEQSTKKQAEKPESKTQNLPTNANTASKHGQAAAHKATTKSYPQTGNNQNLTLTLGGVLAACSALFGLAGLRKREV